MDVKRTKDFIQSFDQNLVYICTTVAETANHLIQDQCYQHEDDKFANENGYMFQYVTNFCPSYDKDLVTIVSMLYTFMMSDVYTKDALDHLISTFSYITNLKVVALLQTDSTAVYADDIRDAYTLTKIEMELDDLQVAYYANANVDDIINRFSDLSSKFSSLSHDTQNFASSVGNRIMWVMEISSNDNFANIAHLVFL